MNTILFDIPENFENLKPLSFTRPISELRIGILTIKEKWEKLLNNKTSYLTQNYLQAKFNLKVEDKNLLINSTILPDEYFYKAVNSLNINECLIKNEQILCATISDNNFKTFEDIDFSELKTIEYEKEICSVTKLWHIFSLNGQEIEKDFKLLTKDKKSQKISSTNTVYNEQNIFLEEGAEVESSILNAKDGYIYIAKNASIMANCVVVGSLALCENAQLKIRTTVYGPTTIGPFSKFGGEINNVVVIGYSNKAHDGFLGNAVIGEWCNLGAGTNNSNLKNNYAQVKLWNYKSQRFEKTGLQFCGLIMGDHSKCGINTMFNTGTVIGISSNIFGSNFPRNFISSFSWGGAHGFKEYMLNKATETAQIMMKRRNIELTKEDLSIFEHVFTESQQFRK